MNVEIGTEAVQFPKKEYINGSFVAVHSAHTHRGQNTPKHMYNMQIYNIIVYSPCPKFFDEQVCFRQGEIRTRKVLEAT